MKDPRFFCEHCGAEVKRNARVCPRCGHFFASVRCPKCGRVGTPDDFVRGCPDCGYAVAANPPPEDFSPAPARKSASAPVPVWAYLLAAVVLVTLLAILFKSLA